MDSFILTDIPEIDTTLCMKGTIRTKERCPRCKGEFQGNPLHCPTCKTIPTRYFIDLYEKGYGRLKIYSDKQGHPLDSYHRALRVLETIRYEIDQHVFDPTYYIKKDLKDFLFETRIENWYQSKLVNKEKGNLAKGYVRILRSYKDSYYLPFFKGMDVRNIRTFHIQQFYEQLPPKRLKYIKNILSALENFFNTLCEQDYISQKPSFPTISIDRTPPQWVDYDIQVQIIKLIPREHRPIFLFLAWQGVRPGEARALQVKDVDLKHGILIIRRTYSDNEVKDRVKSKIIKPRAINPALIGLLKRCCKDKHPAAYVFTNPYTGRPYSESTMKRLWVKVKEAGFKITTYQATRHSLATNLLKNGAELKSIGDILGHTDIRTTLKYAHSDINNQRMAFTKAKVFSLCPQTVPRARGEGK